jgi:hypothetical protein
MIHATSELKANVWKALLEKSRDPKREVASPF